MASLAQRMVQDVLALMPWLTSGAIELSRIAVQTSIATQQNKIKLAAATASASASATGTGTATATGTGTTSEATHTHVGVGSPEHRSVCGVVTLWLALGCCYESNGKLSQALAAYRTGCVLGLGHGGMLDAGFLAVYGPSQVSCAYTFGGGDLY